MPKVGERRLGSLHLLEEIYKICPECQQGYWSRVDKNYPFCRTCGTKVGKRYIGQRGDIYIRLAEADLYYPMTVSLPLMGEGWIREARLVMAKKLGRYLEKGELVSHKDGDKANNSPDNLTIRSKQSVQRSIIIKNRQKKR